MSTPVDYRIREEAGRRFAVLPLEQFAELVERAGEADALPLPHEIISRHLTDEVPLARCWREYLGMTQTELAGRLEVSQAQIAQWERPGASLRHATLKKLASAMGIQVQQLDPNYDGASLKPVSQATPTGQSRALECTAASPSPPSSSDEQFQGPTRFYSTARGSRGLVAGAMEGQPTKDMANHLELIDEEGGILHGKELLLQMAYELQQLPSSDAEGSTASEYAASMCMVMVRQLWTHVPDEQLEPMSNGQSLLVLGYLYGTLTMPSHVRHSEALESEITVLQANLKRREGGKSNAERKQAETSQHMAQAKRIWDELIRTGRAEHGLPQVVQDRLAARGVRVSVDTVARWARKGGWRSKTKKRTR
ncbi:helix-turn-helix domain-containing protein [Halomonas campaniensis]|uniref:helix-turn-helix domain-containing protein n=1 Tax=Halomonas campaniensis TaxID=213554 RepID=UPI003568BC9B